MMKTLNKTFYNSEGIPNAWVFSYYKLAFSRKICASSSSNWLKNSGINTRSIDIFSRISRRSKNKESNDTREKIIYAVINEHIPNEWYSQIPNCSKWYCFKKRLIKLIHSLVSYPVKRIECISFAARNRSVDFKLIINGKKELLLNFKFNELSVFGLPQIISVTNPSKYLLSAQSFEDFYYSYFLGRLIKKANKLGTFHYQNVLNILNKFMEKNHH
jgi:hypothetical protein